MISAIADILLLARLSALEYSVDEDWVAAGVNALGLGFIGQVGSDECQALVADWPMGSSSAKRDSPNSETRAVVCFRGTQVLENTSLPEIGDDLDLHRLPAPSGVGFVHRGFWAPLAALWPRIAALLPAGASPIYTGHSLGGARAHLASALLSGEAITFGAPKAADAAFWAYLYPTDRPPLRIVHEEDFAPGWSPLLPWSTHPAGAIGWLHSGRLYRVSARTTWINESVLDHSIDRYVAALAALDDRAVPRAA